MQAAVWGQIAAKSRARPATGSPLELLAVGESPPHCAFAGDTLVPVGEANDQQWPRSQVRIGIRVRGWSGCKIAL